ncbi:MAG: hypothetical protein RMI91_05410 [Gemmatales bacterium]|nr:hypothetical protein [Gemmatales bacterium]MDW7994073.1 hypothetical protein [Gemmatales bacterium]
MRKILLAAAIVAFLWPNHRMNAGDHHNQVQTGINWRWHHPSFVWWFASRGPHGGHWFALGHPPEIFHPYPWFLVYPTGVTWPSTPGWVQHSGYPDTPWAGYSFYPSAGLTVFPGWPHPGGVSPAQQPPIVTGHTPHLPGTGGHTQHVPTPSWPAPQMAPYYWFGR